MRAKDLMSSDLFTIRAEDNLIAGHEIMKWARIRHVPVVDAKGALVGIVSHRDLLRASVAASSMGTAAWSVKVSEVMTAEVKTIGPETPVQEAARLMRHHKIGCLLVLDGGRLAGILTAYDLLEVVEKLGDE